MKFKEFLTKKIKELTPENREKTVQEIVQFHETLILRSQHATKTAVREVHDLRETVKALRGQC